jgi:hypothetical protein
MNTHIIAFSNPCYDGMETTPFALTGNSLYQFSSNAFTLELLLSIEGDLNCSAVTAPI